jgi:hypothetical protein
MSVSGAGYELAVLVALREMSYFHLRFDLLSRESPLRINPHQRNTVRCAPTLVIHSLGSVKLTSEQRLPAQSDAHRNTEHRTPQSAAPLYTLS